MAAESVKVIARCRPMNTREKTLACKTIVSMDPARGQCLIVNPEDPAAPPKNFTFDGVYFVDSTAEQIYNDIVYPLVENVLEGYNGTVFAYGQTGSGKTFSMQGTDAVAAQRGIIPRAFEHIFEAITTTDNLKFLVHASYLEIYNEEVRDLLGKDVNQKLDIKQHPEKGVYTAGLSLHAVHNKAECEELMSKGFKNRHVGATAMNQDSSRSHSIFSVHVEMLDINREKSNEHIKTGKLHLVDLAGSERQSKTGTTGMRFKESTKINLSLSALGNVISALVDGKSNHIPYRDSKLTRLLQDSLGGNTKTIMVACLSPADNNHDESLSTLRYANRAKNIKNKPTINEDPKDALLREFQEEIMRLKSLVANDGVAPATVAPPVDLERERAALRQEYEAQMADLKRQYHDERQSNARLQESLQQLSTQYAAEAARVEASAAATETPSLGAVAPSSSPTQKAASSIDPGEAMKRLELLQQQMVGGEQAGNTALKEKRQRKKRDAEKRMQSLADALSKVKSDDPMLHVYNTVHDKLEAVTAQLDKEKKTVKSLENEIHDLQGEFELDRIDYLDTIRRQDQQLKLLQQIIEKVQPCLRRDSNYANVDKIKKEAVWDDDLHKWHLPEVTIVKTQLPYAAGAGGMMPGGRIPTQVVSPRQLNGYAGANDDQIDGKLKTRLEQSALENFAYDYFRPAKVGIVRRNELDKHRTIDKRGTHFPNSRNTWETLTSGVIYTNDIYEGGCDARSDGSPGGSTRKPHRLESINTLAIAQTTPKKQRKNTTW